MTTAAEVTETTPPPQQLRMVWPRQRLTDPPEVRVHPDYELRTYRPGDEAGWIRVMDLAGFGLWDMERLTATMQTILPNGWFLAVHRATDVIVATAMTTHHPTELHPFGGELGSVPGDPAHKGKGLGWTVCAAVTRRYLAAGYENIFLRTDDWRLPAIMVYLRLGFLPFLFAPDMAERWEIICHQLNWPYTPEDWPAAA